MSLDLDHDHVDSATIVPLLLDEHPTRVGPKSWRLLARLVIGLALVQLLAAALIFGAGGARATAADLSLVLPGGGFLYDASPELFVVTAGLTIVALVLWWGASFHLSIPIVWAASVGGAAGLAGGPRLVAAHGAQWGWATPAVYALAVALVVRAGYRFERAFRRKRAQIPELNRYLAGAELPVRSHRRRPLDAMDAELLRWCVEFARQPDDGLKGLDGGEQFHGGTQLRYQLNAYCWALCLYAANYLPNAPAQVTDVLERWIVRHTDLRVWNYWRALNLLGNFDADPDPIRRDNIMFSGFLGDVLNSFEAATGSPRFDAPGSLTFVAKDGRTFEYDHHSIAAAVHENFERSKLGFFPCEPGWSFTVCNIMGAQTLFGHDTLHGSTLWRDVRDRWQDTLEHEYLTPDGSYAHIRSNLVGLSWDTGEVPGGHYFTQGTHRLADILPEHARRGVALELRAARPKMAELSAAMRDGRLDLELPPEPDGQRTRTSRLLPWNKVLGGASSVGDEALFDAALDASVRQAGTGSRWPQRPLDSGAMGLAGHMTIRWSSPLNLAELCQRGYVTPSGPVLRDAPWDDLLVTEATCDDGRTLTLGLQPYGRATTTAVLRFDGLVAGATYALRERGEVLAVGDADADGVATVTVEVAAARTLSYGPAGEVAS